MAHVNDGESINVGITAKASQSFLAALILNFLKWTLLGHPARHNICSCLVSGVTPPPEWPSLFWVSGKSSEFCVPLRPPVPPPEETAEKGWFLR